MQETENKKQNKRVVFRPLVFFKDNRDNRDNPFLLPVSACKQGKKLSLLALLSLKPPQAKAVLEEGEYQ